MGAGLGADVAAQVRPRRYLATGAGERLTPLPPPVPYGVLVIPSHLELSTADVYREFDRQGLQRDAADLAARLREVSTAAADLPDELIANDLEPAARALCPEIDDALATARDVGAHHALVCGSGPTVIGLFSDLRGARGAAARLFERDPRPIAVAPWGAML
jgi:4-diphosphocytidyl-2-C-methyl-D-erythritol kinase